METSDILDTQIISQANAVRRVRRWWRGIHPEKGIITRGLTGWETVEERDLLPVHILDVNDEPPPSPVAAG